MKNAVIVSAVRTAVGSFNGSLASFSAVDLGTLVIKEALTRANAKAEDVDEVIMGNVLQGGLGQNPARQAAVKAGLPCSVPAFTVNKVCGSGLKTVALAAQAIIAGDAEVIVAGGMESMSNAGYILEKARFGYRMGDGKLVDSMVKDGLWCAFNDYHMGVTAENIAEKYQITRAEQDALALLSQQKAAKAVEKGAFKKEIMPVVIKEKKGEKIFDTDEYIKANTTMEALQKLRTAFKKEGGTVTAGNASGVNDGAAACVVMAEDKAQALGLKPLAKICAYGVGGVDPSIMGMGPVTAVQKALKKAGMTINDLDLIEANEAFAVQFLAVGKELGFNAEKVNINGGAIALGHPIGASGTRILVTLLHAMEQNNKKTGLATLCIGGGQGIALIVER